MTTNITFWEFMKAHMVIQQQQKFAACKSQFLRVIVVVII